VDSAPSRWPSAQRRSSSGSAAFQLLCPCCALSGSPEIAVSRREVHGTWSVERRWKCSRPCSYMLAYATKVSVFREKNRAREIAQML